MAWLAQEHDVCRGMTLDVVRKLKTVQVRHCLKAGEFLSRTTDRTDVLSVLQIEIRIVELFAAFKLGLVL